MGKFNLKFVKPVASLAIGAAVLTGSFAVTGAADTAFAKAATVKVSKGKLVSAKSGKAVKGYKSYKGVLYKNGKKFTGLYKNTYYKSGKKGTGLYKNVYYKAGKKGSGWVGSGSSKKWYQDGKLLTGLGKNSGKLFIKGKYANGIQTYKGVEKLYKDGVVVKTVVDAAKAINNTTVEVTFAEAQKANDISAGRFVIDGLEVTNAAIKQTDAKVIVLTTAAQTGGKTYTVALDGVKSRTFKGVSNVLPTAITNTTPSLQGVIGQQVTVKTQVEVPAGQSKEGIAVTFSITNSADTSVGNFGKKIVAEAFTDANGVASYSYTQYVAGTEDIVEAYPTGNASVKATAAKVYWGNAARLTLTDVTEGTSLANGSKKIYKIASAENANGFVNVAFKENVNVDPNKLVRNVKVTDASTKVYQNGEYPYQVTTGGVQYVQIKLDSKGEATFTLTGNSATVTPIVFADGSYAKDFEGVISKWSGNNKYEATELQAQANPVTFGVVHNQTLKVEAKGVQRAAYDKTVGVDDGVNDGGRNYVVTFTNADGKVAPAGSPVKVVFKKSDLSSDKDVYLKSAGGVYQKVKADTPITLAVKGSKGEVEFSLTGDRDGYAAPTVFIDNDKFGTTGALDSEDTQTTGETTYFVDGVITSGLLTVNGLDENSKISTSSDAIFSFTSLDQNENPYYFEGNKSYENFKASFQVTATFADVWVNGYGKVTAGQTVTVTAPANKGVATITVKALDGKAADVVVKANASEISITDNALTVSFVNSSSTISVPAAIIAALKEAGTVAQVQSVLKDFPDYAVLKDDTKDAVAQTILDSVKNGTITAGTVAGTLEDGQAKDVANAYDLANKTFVDAATTVDATNVVEAKKAVAAYKALSAKAQVKVKANVAALENAIKAYEDGLVDAQAVKDAADYDTANKTFVDKTTTVDATNVVDAKKAVAAFEKLSKEAQAKVTAKVADLKVAIKTYEDGLVVAALKNINDAKATLTDFETAGITGVTIYNIDKVKAAVAAKKDAKGSDLDVKEIQEVVTNLPK
ncbi:hypothetical protein [Viridibacillus arvi]|uniref:hypothetical protein n=1 Tax=Viridibacillus arvi TaxID=263475 RepID=UPI0034CF6893